MAHKSENGIKRCLLDVDGLAGFVVAIVGLLVTLFFLAVWSVKVQSANSEVYYSVNQDLDAIKTFDKNNNSYRINK